MHIHEDHLGHHDHAHTHEHEHEHTHEDGVTHSHPHTHEHTHDHAHPHTHEHLHEHDHEHSHSHDCDHDCHSCGSACQHTPMEELAALMQYMASHNAAHANELANLAHELEKAGNHMAFEQVMAAVSDYEKGNLRLQAVLASLK